MSSTIYNYTIIGAGCAGIHLALAIMEEPFFADKQILILEKEAKDSNDRTWCFWEEGSGKWDQLLQHCWAKGKFIDSKRTKQLEMEDYQYKMLHAIDFYNNGISKIKAAANFHWKTEEVQNTETKKEAVHLFGKNKTYKTEHLFDSRIHPDFFKAKDKHSRLLQHFKGWVIETEEDFFDPTEFTMMDFRLKWEGSTSFNYVLPTSKRKALVEFTLFTAELIPDDGYDQMMREYLKKYWNLENFRISNTEQGIIPMSDYPFHKHHNNKITKIGTAGGWVRPSSGYAFKLSEKYAHQIVQNIKAGKRPSLHVANSRFRKYDTLLLDILKNKNERGADLFSTMFNNNKTTQIFKFLDEETNFWQDLRIMASFNPLPFLKAVLNQVK
jgi:lycopene beta-cyclase